MKSIDYMISVMQAFADGKEIEVENIGRSDWGPAHTPCWNWGDYNYRVKPEAPKKKIVPYENAEEFLAAQKEHGCFVCYNGDLSHPFPIGTTCNNAYIIGIAFDEVDYATPLRLYKEYTWCDGSLCGKEVEE